MNTKYLFCLIFVCLLFYQLGTLLVAAPSQAESFDREKAVIQSALGQVEATGNPLTRQRWSPYTTGICIGILSWIAFLLLGKGLGASSSFAATSGMIEKALFGKKAEEKAYYQKIPPVISSGWMLVAGILAGSFLSAKLSGDFQLTFLPALWQELFGSNVLARIISAFIGGMILMIGARWAGGCTSGHGITGSLQLAVSSWMALIAFFVGGVVMAYVLYLVFA
ncbi:MAG: YeeE/YedE family protein [Desulfohalobiaceae bacterium]|nr:YeeE/YedE family protein [Desulfohalobiaceae bacterium]